jgi:hypothetical protein
MSLQQIILKTRNLAMIAALAVSMNAFSQTKPKTSAVVQPKSNVKVVDPKKDLTHKLSSDKKYYTFDNKNFIIDKYDSIPIFNKNKPVYETLLYDTAHKYFCFAYKQEGAGLHQGFLKVYTLLKANGVDDRKPFKNETFLPPIFPDSVARGTIHKNHPLAYKILSETLITGYGSIHRWWAVKGDTVESVFNKDENAIKIHQTKYIKK